MCQLATFLPFLIDCQLIIIILLLIAVHACATHKTAATLGLHLDLILVDGKLVRWTAVERLEGRLASLFAPLIIRLKAATLFLDLSRQILAVFSHFVLFDVDGDRIVQRAQKIDVNVHHSVGQKLHPTIRKVPRKYPEQYA